MPTHYRFSFSTEVSLNLADDSELLALFRTANFAYVFIGIESPDEASLKETGKIQNMRRDMLAAVRTVYSHGIDVLAGSILGFDNGTPETFERQCRFIRDSGIQVAMVGLLTALPRTPLYARLDRDGRLLPQGIQGDNRRTCHARLRGPPFRSRPAAGRAPGPQDGGLAAPALQHSATGGSAQGRRRIRERPCIDRDCLGVEVLVEPIPYLMRGARAVGAAALLPLLEQDDRGKASETVVARELHVLSLVMKFRRF
jgi:hypothetical protein